MRFPKQKLRFTKLHDGRTVPEGYIVLDLKGVDMEGVTSLVLEVADIEAARAGGDQQEEAKRRARELLGG